MGIGGGACVLQTGLVAVDGLEIVVECGVDIAEVFVGFGHYGIGAALLAHPHCAHE